MTRRALVSRRSPLRAPGSLFIISQLWMDSRRAVHNRESKKRYLVAEFGQKTKWCGMASVMCYMFVKSKINLHSSELIILNDLNSWSIQLECLKKYLFTDFCSADTIKKNISKKVLKCLWVLVVFSPHILGFTLLQILGGLSAVA